MLADVVSAPPVDAKEPAVVVPDDDKQGHETNPSPGSPAPAAVTEGDGDVQLSPNGTIQFSDATTPADYGDSLDKPFVVLETNGEGERGQDEGGGHEGVSLQNGSGEPIIVMESGEGESPWSTEGDNHELKRVKVSEIDGIYYSYNSYVRQVYELQGQRWVDQGTAFCFGHYDEAANEAMLIARAESDYSTVVLQTTIRSSDVYAFTAT